MTEETRVLIEELNKYLVTAPETFFTKNHGRTLTKDKITSFLYLHCLEDVVFDNYSLIQVCQPRLVGYVLDEALSSLSRVWGDTSDGESFYEMSMMETSITSSKLVIKFGIGYGIRAIVNELSFGKKTRWVNVPKEHQQLTNLLQGATQ